MVVDRCARGNVVVGGRGVHAVVMGGVSVGLVASKGIIDAGNVCVDAVRLGSVVARGNTDAVGQGVRAVVASVIGIGFTDAKGIVDGFVGSGAGIGITAAGGRY